MSLPSFLPPEREGEAVHATPEDRNAGPVATAASSTNELGQGPWSATNPQ